MGTIYKKKAAFNQCFNGKKCLNDLSYNNKLLRCCWFFLRITQNFSSFAK